MKIIGSKVAINLVFNELELQCKSIHSPEAIAFIHKHILRQKVRFPVLEYLSGLLYKRIPARQLYPFLNRIGALRETGGYVIIGKLLQMELDKNFKKALEQAEKHMIKGNVWYVCDIIGERVMGHALLTQPQRTLPVLKRYAKHHDEWMVRCIGVAGHYAIKKGLEKKYVKELFALLLSLSNVTAFHTKKGIGWAAKTTAKFYPDIIRQHGSRLANDPDVKQWFKTKVKIGLGRSFKYTSRFNR